ncbi:hypothetical protein CTAYLR_010063 [Chrysophaeum taylorii]|uniref:ABC transporter domain-containing protein n=1 Tax=Chrysophaeum taylorii TaxID=2483200 RepID=A0AAD7U901_9STRA|nr:hypothetical protein CTAYLR_010063 [Chrysophaeum taylorii]
MGKCRVFAGDEISTGLDSQTTFEITRAFKFFTQYLHITVVLSLLQPPPETFALFDKVILLDKGAIAFHGPTDEITRHFASIGILAPPRKDVADFLVEITSSRELVRSYSASGRRSRATDFPKEFMESEYYRSMCAALDENKKDSTHVNDWGEYYSTEFTEPFSYYVAKCLERNLVLLKKGPEYLKVRFGQATVMGIFTGTLYYNTPYDDFTSIFGLIFSALMYLALAGMSSMPGLIERRDVFYKQRNQSYFPTVAYTLSQVVVDVIITLIENVLYANLVYWPAGLSSSRFGVFLAVSIVLSLAMSQWFGFIAAIAPDGQSAQPMAGMSIVLSVLFSGFIVQRENIPRPWRPLHWVSPIALAWRAVSISEFRSDRYNRDNCPYQQDELGCTADDPCCVESEDGIFFLKTYSVQTTSDFIFVGIVVLAFYFCLSIVLQTVALSTVRHSGHGSGPPPEDLIELEEEEEEEGEAEKFEATTTTTTTAATLPKRAKIADQAKKTAAEIPYTPTTIAFDDVHYTVMVPSATPHGAAEPLELLGGVTGFAKPATMTALMGSSGAGKTTLLDVLASRKKTGKIEGDIRLNGHPTDPISFSRISGYVEQLDVHNPGPTVFESVDFSASLRLERKHAASKRAFVAQLLDILELAPIAGHQVGTITTGGLTFEQRKRLTMAVELAANPAILFLDEPTSGLDSRAALVVIRATRNIAATGRSVICTIHQPSYALFSVFDRLLLLSRGGRTVYFGDIGNECETLIAYLEKTILTTNCKSVEPKLPDGANPATWMLACCSAKDADFASAYFTSQLAIDNTNVTREALEPAEGYVPHKFSSPYVLPVSQQFPVLVKRMFISYWRGPSYNVARGMVSIVIALIFGSCYSKSRPDGLDTFSEVLGRVGLFFLCPFFMGIIFFSAAQSQMAVERAPFYREKAARIYSPLPYTVSFGVVETPYLLLFSFLHSGFIWSLVDFYPGVEQFFFYFAYYLFYVSFATFFAQFLVAAMPDEGTAQTVGNTFLTLSSLVAGFSITPDNIPDYWIITYWLSPIHYTLEGIVVTQFHGADRPIADLPGEPSIERYMASHWSDSHFGGFFTYSHRFQNLVMLAIFCGVFRTATLLALTFLDYTTR